MKKLFVFLLMNIMIFAGCSLIKKNNTSVVTSYYRTKEILAVVNRKEDMRHGASTKYYKNGSVMEEAFYKENKKDGFNRMYFENGNIKFEKVYKEGVLLSLKEYDEEGNLLRAEEYKNGELIEND